MPRKSPAKRNLGTKSAQMSVTGRFVNTKRHTVGYRIDGKRMSVTAAVKLARQGKIRNARAVGNHVQTVVGMKPLFSLPVTIV